MNIHQSGWLSDDHIEANQIIEDVAKRRQVTRDEIMGRSRRPLFCHARFEVMHLLISRGWSQNRVARFFRVDPTTVLSGRRRYAEIQNKPAPHRSQPNSRGGAWSEKSETLLRDQWAAGWSSSAIAKALGVGFSRNAVIGKIRRLNLPTPAEKLFKPPPPRPLIVQREPKPKKMRVRALVRKVERKGPAKRLRPPPIEKGLSDELTRLLATQTDLWTAPEGRGVELIDATLGQCRWPFGEPRDLHRFRFCGEAVDPSHSYCPLHRLASFSRGTNSERRATDTSRVPAEAMAG